MGGISPGTVGGHIGPGIVITLLGLQWALGMGRCLAAGALYSRSWHALPWQCRTPVRFPGEPALKAFFRNAPPNKRMRPKHERVEPAANNHCAFERCSDDARSQRAGVLEYAGPPHLEAVLAWAKAVDAWDGSDKIPVGWEIGKREDLPADDSSKTAKGNAKASSSSSTGTGGSASGSKADPEKDEV